MTTTTSHLITSSTVTEQDRILLGAGTLNLRTVVVERVERWTFNGYTNALVTYVEPAGSRASLTMWGDTIYHRAMG